MTRSLRVAMTLEQCWHRVPGGTAVAALGMARALTQLEGLSLIGVGAAHAKPPRPPWTPPIAVRHLLLPRVALYRSWHRLRAPRVERATGPVDVIHATTIAMPPRTAPIVLTIHDLAFMRDPGHFTARGIRFFMRGLELALKEADLVLCPSRATMRDCAEHGFDVGRLRHVPLGVEVRSAAGDDVARVKNVYGLERDYVLWTGTIEPRKNLRGLIAAFSKVTAPVDLVLAGPSGWNEDLNAIVSEAGLGERVRTLGFVPQADLGPLYAGARVFCFPSITEGFGFPVLEAMAHGTPVVTSAGTSTEEIAGDAALVVAPHDHGAIADALNRVLHDAALADRLGRAGRQRSGRYSWDNTARLVMQSYVEAA